jgi:AcrR family transcriptional regulator
VTPQRAAERAGRVEDPTDAVAAGRLGTGGRRGTGGRDELLCRVVDHLALHGIGAFSLRSLADAIGTSHRMLLYHFGSREGLLEAVVGRVESDGQLALAVEHATDQARSDPLSTGLRFWRAITDRALIYGPLFFELTSHAMIGLPHAAPLRDRLVDPWIDALAGGWAALGVAGGLSRTYARIDLAVARGLLHDLLLSGDRSAVDAAMRTYAAEAIASRLPPGVAG